MKLGLTLGYSGSRLKLPMEMAFEAERLGFDSVWTAEAYGSDAVTTATWILAQTERIKVGTAIMQLPARSPACTAMTAMSLDHMSNGRFLLGLGPSGPQVAEGWHGVPYGKPLTRTKEYIAIIREILKREGPVVFDGEYYQLPNTGPGTTGLGKPLKSILHGDPSIPIYTASISPNGLACSAEVADGVFPLWMTPDRFDVIREPLEKGFAKAGGGKSLENFNVIPGVSVFIGDDLEKCRLPVKGMVSLYVGGMGARDKNFYNDYVKRMGYEAAAKQIQDLYLDGKKAEALAAVPDELVDEIALVGPVDRIKERLPAWKDAAAKRHIDTLNIGTNQPEALRLLAEELL